MASAATPRRVAGGLSPGCALALFALLNSVLLPLVLRYACSTEPAYAQTEMLLHPWSVGRDSWNPMIRAFAEVLTDPSGSLYENLFFRQHLKFLYPPTALLVLAGPPDLLGFARMGVLLLVSWLFVLVTVVCVIWLLWARWRPDGRADAAFGLAGAIVLLLTFYPVIFAYAVGQIQVWINALFAVALLAWVAGRSRIAGGLVGAMCLLKPQYGVLLLWGALRRRWGFVASGAVVMLLALAMSISLFGLHSHVEYFRVLSFITGHGEAYATNQSINGLLHHLLGVGDSLVFTDHSYPPYNAWIHAGTIVTATLFLGYALLGPVAPPNKGSAVDFSLVALTSTFVSPVAWEHHFGILLPIYALLFPGSGRWRIVLAVSFVLTSNYFDVLLRVTDRPADLVQSYVLAGALIVFVLLERLRRRPVSAYAPGSTAPLPALR